MYTFLKYKTSNETFDGELSIIFENNGIPYVLLFRETNIM